MATTNDPTSGNPGLVEAGTLIDLLARRDLDLDHPAVICGDTELNYAEFEAVTNRIARALIARGAGAESVVAVALDRSAESVIAVWGIAKSGAAFLPIDPSYPLDRIEYMLDDSAVEIGITDGATRERLGGDHREWLRLDDLDDESLSGDPLTPGELNGPVRLGNLAYLTYTSGSTGRPKGVSVTHAGIADLMETFAQVTGPREDNPDTRILHLASASFDPIVVEMAAAVLAGHTLVVAPQADYAGDALGEVIENHEVTDVIITPTVLATVDPDFGETVEHLAIGGEACPPEVVERWAARGRRIFNVYGPAEATVWATRARLLPGKPVTIGRGIVGFTTYVLDTRLHQVPQGVVGELYLSAPALARGYLNKPAATVTSFVADPFDAPGARMYATGDLVRVNASGDLEYAGRADHQVKVSGQRIELGEIEAVLTDQPGITQALVLGVDDAASGRTRLVGYVVAPDGADVDAVLSAAASTLPAHMVPAQLIALDAMPLTPGGKLDRAALPAPSALVEAGYVAPEGEVERTIAAIIAGFVGHDQVGATDSFFALGGDSIMSIQLSSALRAAGYELRPRDIFELKTVRALAHAVGERESVVLDELPGGPGGEVTLPPMVRWMLERSDTAEDFADFSQSQVLALPAGSGVNGIGAVLTAMVANHPMLTATLTVSGDTWSMTAGATEFDAAQAVTMHSVAAAPGTDAFTAAVEQAHAEAIGRLDPTRGAMVAAAGVLPADGSDGRLVLAIHHAVVDIVSWQTVIADLVVAAGQIWAGQAVSLNAEGTSVRRWSQVLADLGAERDDEIDYWREQLPTTREWFGRTLDRVADRERAMGEVSVTVSADITERLLTTVPEAFGAGASEAMVAALAVAVDRWAAAHGHDCGRLSILLEGHGRAEEIAPGADLARTVGWFTALAPVGLDLADESPRALIKQTKEAFHAEPENGIAFTPLLFGPHGERFADRGLPAVSFNYGGNRGVRADNESAAALVPFAPAQEPYALPGTISGGMVATSAIRLDAGIATHDGRRELVASLGYLTTIFSEAAAREIAGHWQDYLAEVAEYVESVGGQVGSSPSDIPGAELTQADVDDLEARFPDADLWPLSPLQGGLYFQSQLAIDSGQVDVYVAQAVLTLSGADADRLRAAAQKVIDHHRVLRSRFVAAPSGAVVAAVAADAELPWTVVDLDEHGTEDVVAERIESIVAAQRVRPFDLATPPLLRFVLVRHGASSTLVVTNHHLILDGWSAPLVLADVLAVYATGTPYTSVASGGATGDFGDYLTMITGRDRAQGLAAWREVLAPVEGATMVAAGQVPEADALPRDYETRLDPETTSLLESVAREHGSTLATVVQVAWAVLVSRLTGNRVVTFGETVSGRPADLDGVETMVGLFINTLPAVVDVDPAVSIGEVIGKVQADKITVLDHQYLSLPAIAAAAGKPVGFDTLTIHESYPVNADSLATADTSATGGLSITDVRASDSTHYPLNMVTAPSADGLLVRLKYLPSAFGDDQIAVFAHALTQIMRAIATAPALPVADIDLLDDAGVAEVEGREWGAEVAIRAGSIVDAVAAQVAATPDAPALWFEGRSVSYAEFGARVNSLARELIESGVGPDSAVALCIPRSVELIVAIHAIVAAGGQYVPIGLGTPADRVEYMLETAGVDLLLVAETSALEAGQPGDIRTIVVSCDGVADLTTTPITDAERGASIRPDAAIYTLFTSGSTGKPKGVTLPHAAVVNRLWWGLDELPIDHTG
ncbi:putative non-ribosomal peptide synthetase, partial [Gordonia amarae NBRC 15530]